MLLQFGGYGHGSVGSPQQEMEVCSQGRDVVEEQLGDACPGLSTDIKPRRLDLSVWVLSVKRGEAPHAPVLLTAEADLTCLAWSEQQIWFILPVWHC